MPEPPPPLPPLPAFPTMPDTAPRPACAVRRYEVGREALPLSCPTPEMALWNAHPRVYLPLEENGRARCPYCGAEYVLVERRAAG